jgi:hypothetical protein
MTPFKNSFDEILQSIKNKNVDFLNKTALVIDHDFDSIIGKDNILNKIKIENTILVSVNKTSYLHKSEIHIVIPEKDSSYDNYSYVYDNSNYIFDDYKRPIIISNDSNYYNKYHSVKSDVVIETMSQYNNNSKNNNNIEIVEQILTKIGCKNIIILDNRYDIDENRKKKYYLEENVHIFTLKNIDINQTINIINSKVLVVLNNVNKNYDVGSLVRYMIKMYYDYDISLLFLKNGIKIVNCDNIMNNNYILVSNMFQDKMYDANVTNTSNSSDTLYDEVMFDEKIKTFTMHVDKVEKFKNAIYFIIHSFVRVSSQLLDDKQIKKILWLNDLHAFANNVQERIDKNIEVQNYDNPYDIPILDKINYLITPSMQYFKNLKINKYDNKVKYLFYILDHKKFQQIEYNNYDKRKNKIILSGDIHASGYKTRAQLNEYRCNDKNFNTYVDLLPHPGYKNNEHITDMNYYKKLCEYKGAFVGNYVYPINFLLAKHIEILMCGCLGFFERNILLRQQLGLIEYVHYIPSTDIHGNTISNINYYIYWLESEHGKKIAKTGAEYVREKYGIKYIQEYINFYNSL